MKHKCNYCDKTSNETRDALNEAGWFFADIRSPVRKYLTACPEHYLQMYDDINRVFKKT